MKSARSIIRFLKKHGIQPESSRNLPFFTVDCVAFGYGKLLKNAVGFSYKVIGALGKRDFTTFLWNKQYVIQKTGILIREKGKRLKRDIVNPIDQKFQIFKKCIRKIESEQINPLKKMEIITSSYPGYMSEIIGVYNCFWRYIGDNKKKADLSREIIKYIGKKRDTVARIYPRVEFLISKITKSIGKQMSFDGDLLRYMSLREMKEFLKTKNITKKRLQELKKRRNGYFFLYSDAKNQEYIISSEKIVRELKNHYFPADLQNIRIIQGAAAYKGRVKGVVYNIESKNHALKRNYILVASQTHPNDIEIIRKSKAIITNEGGILSHAAIIARELKKPAIISTRIATQVLRDGDKIDVDATKGIIKRI